MTLFWLSCRQCLSRLALLLPITLVIACIGARGAALLPTDAAAETPSLWLHLPLFVTVLAACASPLERWPLFARARPGAGWIERLRPGPWRGCGAASLGALAAAACGCAAIGLLAPLLVGRVPTPRTHVDLCRSGELPVLAGGIDELVFAVPAAEYDAVLLRPRAFVPAAELVPTRLVLSSAGVALSERDIEVVSTDRLVRVAFAPRRLEQLQLRRSGGTVPLAFPPGSVVAVAAAPHSAVANAVLAALLYLLPMCTVLGALLLGARRLALPFGLLLLLLLLLVLTVGGGAPTGDGIAALLRGRWLPGEGVFRAGLPSLGAGAVAMILAMNLPRRRAR